jgi:dipeptidyl aminopeptidase/acylaminoacyl peptidase
MKTYRGSIEMVTPKGERRRIARFPKDTVCVGGSLSPDGKYLAYATQRQPIAEEESRKWPILVFIMRSDGTGKRQVATTAYRGESLTGVYRVSWSPDGTRVAIPVREKGKNRIALVSVRTREKTYLPVPIWADVTCPDWSPDGKSIAYSCEDRRWKPESGEGTDWTSFQRYFVGEESGAEEAREYRKLVRPASTWMTDLGSGKSRCLAKSPGADVVYLLPRWSPGGTRIAYAREQWIHEAGDMHYWWLGLRVVERDGGKDREIKDTSDREEAGQGPVTAAGGEMAWMPDGARIVFMGCPRGTEGRATGLAMVRVDGTEGWPLTPGMGDWPKISLQDDDGHRSEDSLLVESFALAPDGSYAVASGALWSGAPAGLWRVPVTADTAQKRK